MTVDRQTEVEIRRLFFAEHWKKGTIATQLDVHRDVVERAVGQLGPAPKHEPRVSVLDPYRGFVIETLERYPRLVSTRNKRRCWMSTTLVLCVRCRRTTWR